MMHQGWTGPRRVFLAGVFLLAASSVSGATDSLHRQFTDPPPEARPWVYWFWLDGNITREGITADLEALARVGIGGALVMEVAQGSPTGPVAFASATWRDLFQFMLAEAQRLGIQVNMNNDAGWCGSGGPWITPELAMQKLTASETFAQGPRRWEAALPRPPTVKEFYRDIAVLAFPTPHGEDAKTADCRPKASASAGDEDFKPERLFDGMPLAALALPRPEPGRPQWVEIEFPQPFTVRTVTLGIIGNTRFGVHGELQVSEDGREFTTLRQFDGQPPMTVLNVPKTTARWFRVAFTRALHPRLEALKISELELSPGFRIEDLGPKAAFIPAQFLPAHNLPAISAWPVLPSSLTIPRDRIVDLTSKMGQDGTLAWEVPEGKWTILRIGHTLTGKENHPAPAGGLGLECDKLSKEAARAAFDGLIGRLIAENRSLVGKALVSTHIDSWEVGSQNWTPRMREEFQRLRGYDLGKFLPVITGRVVDSPEVSERFLWDLRRTVADLVGENYAAELRRLANRHGMRLSIEAYFGCPSSEIAYGGQADEPMAEFWWTEAKGGHYSCTEMASAAHVCGRRIVAAEAFTAGDKERWQCHPGNIKDLGDWAFCEGINRFVFHRYALQPWLDRRPGMSMGPWGLHYERTQTWWEQSRAWHEYLARCQFLLQQGLFVADICCLESEGAPSRFSAPASVQPAGSLDRPVYNFDGCPPEVLLTRMTVSNGRLVLPDGMSYRVLLLPEVETMTPQLLGKIKELVEAGATVIGPKAPIKSPSLADYPQCDDVVRRLAAELWGSGKIVSDKSPAQVLAGMGVPPDFSSRSASGAQNVVRFTHRAIGTTDVYFLANKNPQVEEAICSFRIQGRRPELWSPDYGQIRRPAAYNETDGCVRVPIRFEPSGSVFVVFRDGNTVEPDRITSVARDGTAILDTAAQGATPPPADNNRSVTNTFTLAAWVKPAAQIGLPKEANAGISAGQSRNDVVYAAPGHEVYPEQGQSCAGISVGTNGVCVYEHSAGCFAPLLVHAAPLAGWTQVAVVYQDGRPSLYLDGRLVHQGLKSRNTVHPGAGVRHGRRVAPFKGEVSGLQQFNRALSVADLVQLARAAPPRFQQQQKEMPTIAMVRGDKGQVEVEAWQAGVYTLKTADGQTRRIEVAPLPPPQEITGPWEVSFDPKWGGPARPVRFEALSDWTERPEAGIRYYSGTATYRTTFAVNSKPEIRNPKWFLDLGEVAVMAEVKLNSHDLGILWKPPFRVEITGALKRGENSLEVRVTNLWINRQIGDEQLPEDSQRNPDGTLTEWPRWLLDGKPSPAGRYTFSSWRLWKQDDPLAESGLLGPVLLHAAETVVIEPLPDRQ